MDNPNNNIVTLGDSLILTKTFIDEFGDPADPTDAQLTIVRSVTQLVAGPYTYSSGTLTKTSVGHYSFTYTPPTTIVPGLYSARWEGTVNGDPLVSFFDFQIVDTMPEPSTILDPPRTYGIMRSSALYRTMGLGQTDRVFLVGHTSGLNLNDPYQVVNMQEAINILGADSQSPMIRGLMEMYNDGCRDIWLVAAAPITEYVLFDVADEENRFVGRAEWGGDNFYERYAQRLQTTYSVLEEWDLPEIVVPLEAPFYDTRGVDFLTPLIDHCKNAFASTNNPRIGVLGTRIVNRTSADVQAMVNDSRLQDLQDAGKYVMVVVGEGTFILPQMPVAHVSSLSTSAAASLATASIYQGITYRILPNVVSPIGQSFTSEEIKQMANVRLNPIIRTQKGKRGTPYQTITACDNTLSMEGSDYWSVSVMHLVSKIITKLRQIGNQYLGTIAYPSFQKDARAYMQGLVQKDYIRGYNLNIAKDPLDRTKVYVDVSIKPYTTVREIYFTVEVGKAA